MVGLALVFAGLDVLTLQPFVPHDPAVVLGGVVSMPVRLFVGVFHLLFETCCAH
jgi:hypothetical protein